MIFTVILNVMLNFMLILNEKLANFARTDCEFFAVILLDRGKI
jgi:hypothetical protein